jgi:two-component system, OmpR family, sensor histidine kinase MtrB
VALATGSKPADDAAPAIRTHRFRWRLAVAFVLVGAIASGALAGASFLVVRHTRLQDSLERDLQRAETSLLIATLSLGRSRSRDAVNKLLATYRRASGFDVLLVSDRGARATIKPLADSSIIPQTLARAVGTAAFEYERAEVENKPYVIVGRAIEGTNIEIFFLFPEGQVQRQISQLGTVLFTGWLVLVVVSGLIGVLLSRQVLTPVSRASLAARSLAEGLLDTRLPVETNDEFGILALSFNEMAQALQQKIAELSDARERERRFTANVAHELRTPVGALVSEASLVRDQLDDIPAEFRRPVQLLVGDVTRLRQLLEDLMEISLFDAGRQRVEVDEVDGPSLISSLLRRRGWVDSVRLDAQPVVLRTDRRRLERVISNLVSNAISYGHVGIVVGVRKTNDKALIEVSDRGPGILPEHLPNVFDRFFKADPSRTGPGTGLGLSIVHENVRVLDGAITVRSEVGHGSTFTVTIPLHPRAAHPVVPDTDQQPGLDHRDAV